MDVRLREVEGDVGTLKDWRSRTVDPWISSGKEFRDKVGGFINRLEAQEELRQELSDQRHQSNSFKLNLLVVLGTFLVALFTLLLVIATYQVAHNKSFLVKPHSIVQTNPIETALESSLPSSYQAR